MKKIAVLLLSVISLLGCSKDNDTLATDGVTSKNGQYVYADKTITAAVYLDGSSTVGITIFENGRYIYQCKAGLVSLSSGDTMEMVFANDIVFVCSFASERLFSAYVNTNRSGVELPQIMRFSYDSSVLDKNGDGLLDSEQ